MRDFLGLCTIWLNAVQFSRPQSSDAPAFVDVAACFGGVACTQRQPHNLNASHTIWPISLLHKSNRHTTYYGEHIVERANGIERARMHVNKCKRVYTLDEQRRTSSRSRNSSGLPFLPQNLCGGLRRSDMAACNKNEWVNQYWTHMSGNLRTN